MTCQVCEARTLGFIVTVQGGTRVLSVAVSNSRKVYCRGCGNARIEALRAAEARKHGAAR